MRDSMKSAAGPFLALLASASVAVGVIEFAGFKDVWAAFVTTVGATIFMGFAVFVSEFGPTLEKAPKVRQVRQEGSDLLSSARARRPTSRFLGRCMLSRFSDAP